MATADSAPSLVDAGPVWISELGRGARYSLGAVLYEILALGPMIQRGEPTRMVALTSAGDLAPPSERASDDVPPELEALWAEAVEEDRSARLASARAISEGIERFLDGDRDREMRRARALDHAERAREEAERALVTEDLEVTRVRPRALEGRGVDVGSVCPPCVPRRPPP